jgi:hypothetical protein
MKILENHVHAATAAWCMAPIFLATNDAGCMFKNVQNLFFYLGANCSKSLNVFFLKSFVG